MTSPAPAFDTAEVFRALASHRRLQILEWLRDPVAHFPPQRDGDLVDDGVCAHLQALARAGLVTSKRVGQWTFYKRDETAIRAFTRQLGDQL